MKENLCQKGYNDKQLKFEGQNQQEKLLYEKKVKREFY